MVPNSEVIEIIFILGGRLINDNGQWRTTNFDEGDNFGAMGDRLRVEAAGILYNQNPSVTLLAAGGQGQCRDIPGAPTVATVIKKELIELGVPEKSIITEEESGNTWQQLQALEALFEKENMEKAAILSNRYHVPRIRAMVDVDDRLRAQLEKEKLTIMSAEEILIDHDPAKWQELIDRGYQTIAMKNRIIKEEEGVRQIKSGVYKLE